MPDELASWDVEELVGQIHAAQRDAVAAKAEREADPAVQAAVLDVAHAKKALDDALAREAEASRKYAERVQLAEQKERELRERILTGWPRSEGKTIGHATVTTRRSVGLRKGLGPADAFRKLDTVLGATGALPKIVVGLKLDAKAALLAVETMPALADVLAVEESRSLTIRQAKPGGEAVSDGGA